MVYQKVTHRLGTGVIMKPSRWGSGTSTITPLTNLTLRQMSYQKNPTIGDLGKQMVLPEESTIGLGTGVIMSPADGDTGTSHHQPPYQPDTQQMVIPEGTTIVLGTESS
eukprot:gene6353-2982_t